MSVVVGLTGGIASGKSSVAKMFTDFHIPIIDADLIARQVVQPGEVAYHQIIEHFGLPVLDENRSLNRSKLAEIIFSDANKRELLNRIVHPEIRKVMISEKNKRLKEGHPSVVMDIPLLFESNLTQLVDKILVVYVDEKTQLERLKQRNGYSTEEALSRIRSQMPIEDKISLADAVIDNNGTVVQSKQQLHQLINEWELLKGTKRI
ncbi:dephospho-CoA kinase [Aquibacillus salsiterrae]|uniref:Dephospho-CoA kinase n=1 Tax=Aquibacillus salsiterrae TaxID=2950439 RepID=A0A9X3WB36_9BACI|nr:dephospho-CoA kinase [Aquibacillus salsiterrae]MDC3415737.1 dephospho-CoA kinase [Aquibacillus salsiterrae]